MLGVGGHCSSVPFDGRLRLPQAEHSCFQWTHCRVTAQPSSQDGGASGKGQEREKHCPAVRSMGKSVRNSWQAPRWEQEEVEEVLQGPQQRFPCSPWRGHSGAGIHPAPQGGPHAGAGGYSLEELWPVKDPHRSKGTVWDGRWGRQGLLETDCSPLFPILLHYSRIGVKRVRSEGVKLCPGNRGGGVFIFVFVSHYSDLFELTIKSNLFLQVRCVLPMMATGKRFAYIYLDLWAFSSYFLPPLWWGEGVKWAAGKSLALSQGQPTAYVMLVLTYRTLIEWRKIRLIFLQRYSLFLSFLVLKYHLRWFNYRLYKINTLQCQESIKKRVLFLPSPL